MLTRNFKKLLRKQQEQETSTRIMKVKVRRKPKKLLAMNARNRVTFEVNVSSSNSRTREQRIKRSPSKLLRMTPPNQRRKRNKKKWPIFASWLLKMKIRYH